MDVTGDKFADPIIFIKSSNPAPVQVAAILSTISAPVLTASNVPVNTSNDFIITISGSYLQPRDGDSLAFNWTTTTSGCDAAKLNTQGCPNMRYESTNNGSFIQCSFTPADIGSRCKILVSVSRLNAKLPARSSATTEVALATYIPPIEVPLTTRYLIAESLVALNATHQHQLRLIISGFVQIPISAVTLSGTGLAKRSNHLMTIVTIVAEPRDFEQKLSTWPHLGQLNQTVQNDFILQEIVVNIDFFPRIPSSMPTTASAPHLFFDPSPALSGANAAVSTDPMTVGVIVGLILASIAVFAVVAFVIFLLSRRRSKRQDKTIPTHVLSSARVVSTKLESPRGPSPVPALALPQDSDQQETAAVLEAENTPKEPKSSPEEYNLASGSSPTSTISRGLAASIIQSRFDADPAVSRDEAQDPELNESNDDENSDLPRSLHADDYDSIESSSASVPSESESSLSDSFAEDSYDSDLDLAALDAAAASAAMEKGLMLSPRNRMSSAVRNSQSVNSSDDL
jgi:hypothetical protein